MADPKSKPADVAPGGTIKAKDEGFNPNPNPAARTSNGPKQDEPNTKETTDTTETSDPLKNPQPTVLGEDPARMNRTPTEQQIADQKTPLVIVGRVGGPFNIDGSGFGDTKGTLDIAGRRIDVTRWNDRSIKGQLPPDIESGEVVLKTPSGERRGTFTHS